MGKTIESRVKESTKVASPTKKERYISFAEQYLEPPIAIGADGTAMARFSATACTYRGIPLWDDF